MSYIEAKRATKLIFSPDLTHQYFKNVENAI